MASITWTGAAGDGNWNTAANWSPAQVPGAGDTVTIDPTVATAISISNDAAGGLTVDKFVTLTVADNTSFTIGSTAGGATTFANAGTLALNSANDATTLIAGAPTLSLTGTGTVLLGNNAANIVEAGTAGDELNNVGNLIEGAGQIGNNDLSFVNGAAGILDATTSAGLVLNTGTSTTLNSGLLEATTGGALYIESVVNDGSSGKISAAGANVLLQGGDIRGGTITSSGGGALVDTNSGTLDGSTNIVSNTGTVALNDNTTLFVFGTLSNSGKLELNSTNDATSLDIDAATVSLTGSGTVLLGNNTANLIVAGTAGNELNDINNLIEGAGQIGQGGTLSFVLGTAAVVNANQSAGLYLSTGSAVTQNSGVLEASGAGTLFIESVVNNGTLGRISANGATVYLQNGDLQGGTIISSGADLINNASGTLDGTSNTVTNTGTVAVSDNTSLDLLGTISNKGTIDLNSTNDATYLLIGTNSGTVAGTVTLTGSGHVILSDDGANYITDGIAGDTLVNLNNTISGGGSFNGTLVVVNDATIDANAVNTELEINTTDTVTNSGTLEATLSTGAGLGINSVVNNGTGGIILAAGGNVYLQNGSLQGGTIKTSGGGEVIETNTGSLDGSAHAVTNLGTVTVDDSRVLDLLGSIVNNGTIALASTNDATYLEITTATVSLTGTGVISLDNDGANYILGEPGTDELDNVSNTIEGGGQIGGANPVVLVNGAAGVIDGKLSVGLTLNVGNNGSNPVANSGLIEATGTGGLTIYNTTVNDSTGGTILASTADVALNSGTIVGGVVSSSGGGAVVVVGGTNLLNGASQAVTIKGIVAVDDNQSLELSGTITNEGAIDDNSANDTTVIEIVSASVTLNGGGTVVLTDDGANYIYGAAGADVLDNVNNTIEGGGHLGNGQLTLINGTAGTISATGTNSQLVINTGGNAVTNSGLIEAVGPAGLLIQSTTISNGTLGVISGTTGTVYLGAADIQGGTLTGAGGFATYGGTTLDGTANTVVNDTTVVVDDNNNLFALGTIDNTGTISVASGNDSTSLYIGPNGTTGTVTLTGSGQIVLSNDAANYIQGNNGGQSTLINLNNTISGGGTIGTNGLLITNDSVVDANDATYLTIDGGSTFTNNDLIESTGTGGLFIYDTTISNGSAGTIAAVSGAVTIQSADILGGSLTGTGGIYIDGGTTLDGTANEIVNKASITLYDNNALYLLGTIDNVGTISLGSTNDSTSLYIGPNVATGTVTLTGGGQIVLSNDGANYIQGHNGSQSTLINLNNTISGGGTIGTNGLLITNDSVVDANDATYLTIDGGSTFTNNDLIESTGTGGLFIYNTTISNGTAGTIAAVSGSVTIQSADILGGSLTGTGGIYTDGGTTLDGTANEIVNKASITLYDNNALYLLGTIDNVGTISLGSTNDSTSLYIGPNNTTGTVTLTGSGQIVLSNDGANYIQGNNGGQSTLINLNNTISGGGTIGTNGLLITNDSVVDANDATRLTIDGGSTLTNNDLIESTGTGGLLIYNTTVSNGTAGTIAAAGGNITVQSATIEGGLITSTASNAIYTNSSSALGAATGTLTNAGSIVLQDNYLLYLDGTIKNNGSITVDSANDTTQLNVNAATVTLTGTGSIVLSNDGANYIDGAGGNVLDNISNTIEGGGNFGNGQLKLINGGIIAADDPTALNLNLSSTGTNLAGGQFLAENGATLAITAGTFTNSGLIQADDASFVTFSGGATLTNNANNGTLTGGSYGAVSTGDGATLSITGSAVSTLAAGIILSGAGSTIEFGGATIDSTLGSVATGGTLSLLAGRNFAVAANNGTLADSGLVSLGGGTFTATSLAIGAGGTLAGFGTVAAAVVDTGTIAASGGTLVLSGGESGAGKLTIASGATADFTVGGALPTSVSGAGTLQLDGAGYTIANAAVSVSTVKVDAGATLTGTGTLTGALADAGGVMASGGTLLVSGVLSGNGALSAASGAVLDLAGGGSFAGSIGGAGTVVLGGATTLTHGASLSAGELIETANLTLNGVALTNSSANTFAITAGTGASITVGTAGTGSSFTNAGHLLANGAGTADIAAPFSNTGTASVTSGTLLIAGALSGSGSFAVAGGALLDIKGGGSFGGAISGAGTLDIAGATTLTAGASLAVANVVETADLTLSSVAVTNAAGDDFTITAGAGNLIGIANAGSGSKFTNTGTLMASGAGTAFVSTAFVDTGTASVTSGTLRITDGLTGAGTLTAGTGALMLVTGGANFGGALNGAGTVEIALTAGTLTAGASLSAAHVLETADLVLSSVAITNAAGDIFTITAASGNLTGLQNAGSGSSFTNAGNLIANGAGTAFVSVAFADTGSASVTSGTLRITDGLTGTGTLSAGTGAIANISGGATFAGALSGAGTIEVTGTAATLANGASLSVANVVETADLTLSSVAITNAAGDDFNITAASGNLVGLQNAGSGSKFTNAGSLIANGAGTGFVSVAFVDTGTASAISGTLRITDGVTGTGMLSAGTGAIVNISGGADFAGALSGAGTIEVTAQAATLTAGASLSATHVLETADLALNGAAITNAAGDTFTITAASGSLTGLQNAGSGSSFTNAGSLIANGAGTAFVSVAFADTGTASVTSGTLRITDGLTGTGTLSAGAGALVNVSGGADFAGALSGAGTIEISQATAVLTTGASLSAAHVLVSADLGLSSVAITNAASDIFTITAGASAVDINGSGSGNGFTNAGSLVANGTGTANINTAFVNSGLVSTNSGTLSFIGSVSNSGTIDAAAGLTAIRTTVAGTGTLDVGSTGTLSLLLGAGSGQAVDFLAGTGLLDLTQPLDFAGTITGFGGSDQIDLLNTPYSATSTTDTYTNNVLTIKNNGTTVADLHFTGTSNTFSLATDNHGGMLITFG